MSAVTPIVLAAGTSSRMGRPKALLPFDGETCLSLVLRACADGGAAAAVVVLGYAAEQLRAVLPEGTLPCLNTAYASTGPAASLQAGLAHVPVDSGAALLFPVDFPLVTGREVAALIDRWRAARPGGARIVLPSHGLRRGHPALFDRSLFPALAALRPNGPIHDVVRAHAAAVEHVVVDEPWVRMDVDTPEDYERCLAAYRDRGR
jgi:molybdenum cofactor cytidylyltransferase